MRCLCNLFNSLSPLIHFKICIREAKLHGSFVHRPPRPERRVCAIQSTMTQKDTQGSTQTCVVSQFQFAPTAAKEVSGLEKAKCFLISLQ